MYAIKDGTGPFTLSRALAWGFRRADIRAMCRSGRWLRLRREVFITKSDHLVACAKDETFHAMEVRAVQLALSRRQVVGADTSAARILAIDLHPKPGTDVVVLTDDPGVASTHRDGYFLRVAPLPPGQLISRHGTPITSAGRTLLDVCTNHGFDEGVIAAESAYRKKLITPEDFGAIVDGNPGRPGILTARDVHAFASPLTESVLESVSRLSFREAGVPMPLCQEVIVDGYPRIRVDFFWPWIRLVGEADGMNKYELRGRPMAELREERQREQRIRDADCDIVRWDWKIASNPQLLAARVFAAMERAEARLRGRAS